MPRLPKNITKRGRMFYFRMERKGKEIYRSLGPNLQEAKRRAALLKQEALIEPRAPEVPDDTVEAFAKRWLDEYVRQRRKTGRRGTGFFLAEQRLSDYVLPVIGHLPLSGVQIPQIRAIRGLCEDAGLSPQTVRHVLADVRCMLRYAVDVGFLQHAPSFASVMPRIPEMAPQRLTDEQLERIFAVLPARHETAVLLALLTGLRWGELRSLQWRHVTWKPKPHLVLENTKSGKVRRVPLTVEAVDVLKREFDRTNSIFVVRTRIKGADGIARRASNWCGFYWTFHQLRHTFACCWLEDGGSKEVLQKILGHSSIRVTERYGHLADDAVFREAERVGSRVSSRVTRRFAVVEAE